MKLKVGKLYREDTGRVLTISRYNKENEYYLFYYLDEPYKVFRIYSMFVNHVTEITGEI